MSAVPPNINLAPARVDAREIASGGLVLSSPTELEPYEPHLGVLLRHWAARRPRQSFLAERSGDGWRRVTWAEALAHAESIGQGLLERGLGAERPRER